MSLLLALLVFALVFTSYVNPFWLRQMTYVAVNMVRISTLPPSSTPLVWI